MAALLSIRGGKTMKKKKKYNSQAPQIRLAMLFLLPWVAGLILFHIYPILSTVYYSFTEYNLMKAPKFVGLQNYKKIFHDDLFYKAVYNSLYFVVIGVTLQIALSVFSAVLLNMNIKGRGISVLFSIFRRWFRQWQVPSFGCGCLILSMVWSTRC